MHHKILTIRQATILCHLKWASRSQSLLLAILISCVLIGCGKEPSSSLVLGGTVTFQGQAIERGQIIFRNELGTPNAYGKIEAGKFTISEKEALVPGTYRVEIFAPQETGKMVADRDEPDLVTAEVRELLPAKYNEMSELTRQIESTTASLDFDLD